LLFKGGIFHAWGKKQAVAIHRNFFDTLPKMAEVAPQEADLAWLIYDLVNHSDRNIYQLQRARIVYTKFAPTMLKLTTAEAGTVEVFVAHLQAKLDEKLDSNPPDAPILTDTSLT